MLRITKNKKERDHRKMRAKEQELFMLSEYGGVFLLLPNGLIIKEELIKYWEKSFIIKIIIN